MCSTAAGTLAVPTCHTTTLCRCAACSCRGQSVPPALHPESWCWTGDVGKADKTEKVGTSKDDVLRLELRLPAESVCLRRLIHSCHHCAPSCAGCTAFSGPFSRLIMRIASISVITYNNPLRSEACAPLFILCLYTRVNCTVMNMILLSRGGPLLRLAV